MCTMEGIIAVNRLGFIGLNGGLPWKCSADLKHFKQMTMGGSLIVGPKTLNTLPKLKGRQIIIADYDYLQYYTTEEAKHFKGTFYDQEGNLSLYHDSSLSAWCIGGKKTYEALCPHFTKLHISHIADDTIGDTTFPDLSNLWPSCKIFHYFFHPSE